MSKSGNHQHGAFADRIDAIFSEFAHPGSPGCAVGVIRDGDWLFKKGYGCANLEHDLPITPDSVFNLASMSKQFTAICIWLLVEQGKLSPNDDVCEYLPELHESGIEVRHLMHHLSGIRDYLSLLELLEIPLDATLTNETLLEVFVRQRTLNFDPGQNHAYTNSGYVLLSILIERVSGLSLAQFAQKHVFEPLGMKSTCFLDDHRKIIARRVSGYTPDWDGDGFLKADADLNIIGDGGVLSSLEDLKKWDANFYQNKLGIGDSGLIQQMLTPGQLNDGLVLDYAGGLILDNYKGFKRVGHGGSFSGFRTEMTRIPELRLTVMLLSNLDSSDVSLWVDQIMDLVFEEIGLSESSSWEIDSTPLESSETKLIVGTYIEDSAEGVLMELAMEGDRLVRRIPDIPDREIVRIGPWLYSWKTDDVSLQFNLDDANVIGLFQDRTRIGQKGSYWRRFENHDATVEEMRSYVGVYQSDELGVTLKLTMEDNALFLHAPGLPPLELVAPIRDDLRAPYGIRLEMIRVQGEINGLRYATFRAYNLFFRKV